MSARVGDFVRTTLHTVFIPTDFGPGTPDLTVEGVVTGVNNNGTIQVSTREGDTFTCLNFKELQGFPDEALSDVDLDFAFGVRADLANKGLYKPVVPAAQPAK